MSSPSPSSGDLSASSAERPKQLEDELLPLDALKGLDSAVIDGFLNLDADVRLTVIDEYSTRHGDAAGTWLRRAATLWPQHRLGVSRVILARLFALLPGHMSQTERLELAKSIWHVARAPSKAVLRVPAGYRNHSLLSSLVHDHFISVLPSVMELPSAMRQSVAWLDDPAMQAQHDVLNLLLLAERDQLLVLVDEQIEVLFARRIDGLEIRSNLKIAGHELMLKTDAEATDPFIRKGSKVAEAVLERFDTQATQSALTGGLIGGLLALAAVVLIFWLGK